MIVALRETRDSVKKKLTANFLGLMASSGSPTKNDSMKHAAAPPQHIKKPRNRSHLDKAKYLVVRRACVRQLVDGRIGARHKRTLLPRLYVLMI